MLNEILYINFWRKLNLKKNLDCLPWKKLLNIGSKKKESGWNQTQPLTKEQPSQWIPTPASVKKWFIQVLSSWSLYSKYSQIIRCKLQGTLWVLRSSFMFNSTQYTKVLRYHFYVLTFSIYFIRWVFDWLTTVNLTCKI